MTLTTPLRLIILHLLHIFFTEDLTFKAVLLFQPVTFYGV